MKIILVCTIVVAAYAVAHGEEEGREAVGLAACDYGRCFRTCMSNGWKGGYCQGNNCVCRGKFRSNEIAEQLSTEIVSNDDEVVVTCDNGACVRACWANGWAGGRCSGGSCQCYRFRNVERVEAPLNNIDTLIFDMAGGVAPAACEAKNCILYCQRMGKTGGKCIGGRCWCF